MHTKVDLQIAQGVHRVCAVQSSSIRLCKVNHLFLVPTHVYFCRPTSTFDIEKYHTLGIQTSKGSFHV